MRDRRALSADGIMFLVATVSADEGSTVADHEIVLRGVPMAEDETPSSPRSAKRSRTRSTAPPTTTSMPSS
jgi:mRNA degradation ribonuclease J1/J2